MDIKEGKYIVRAKNTFSSISKQKTLFKKGNEYKAERGNEIWFITDDLNESHAYSNHNIVGKRLIDFHEQFILIKKDDSIEIKEDIITIKRDSCSNMITVKVKENESVWVLDDGVDRIAGDIRDLLEELGIKSEIVD